MYYCPVVMDTLSYFDYFNFFLPTIKFTAEISDRNNFSGYLYLIRAKDSRKNLFLTSARISNRQNLSNTQNFPPVTIQALEIGFIKELTTQRPSEENVGLNEHCKRGVILTFRRRFIQKLNLAIDCRQHKINKRCAKEFFLL